MNDKLGVTLIDFLHGLTQVMTVAFLVSINSNLATSDAIGTPVANRSRRRIFNTQMSYRLVRTASSFPREVFRCTIFRYTQYEIRVLHSKRISVRSNLVIYSGGARIALQQRLDFVLDSWRWEHSWTKVVYDTSISRYVLACSVLQYLFLIEIIRLVVMFRRTNKSYWRMGLCYNSGHDDKIVLSERKINHVQNSPELRWRI
jgi:hypothetical protein